ncbi:MAG: orotidine 5'-phosphate decarboxylase [Crenarchaeota archaeon]|nr:orotidine 5'-phosphate decarboxylase [Thermoproteota archaeon]
MLFKQKMAQVAKSKKSCLVLALDFPFQSKQERKNLLTKSQDLLDSVSPYICAVKFNHHLTLPLGVFDGVQKLITKAQDADLLTIMDGKVNDIGSTNKVIAEYYFDAGFDALIANPFVGWEEGLKPLFDVAAEQQRGIILLGYMSHKGANEGYGQAVFDSTESQTKQYLLFAKKALSFNADGIVVGATVPDKICEIRQVLGDNVPIYSPGVGEQGGIAEQALSAGTKYLIVGRNIINAQKPSEQARKLSQITFK